MAVTAALAQALGACAHPESTAGSAPGDCLSIKNISHSGFSDSLLHSSAGLKSIAAGGVYSTSTD